MASAVLPMLLVGLVYDRYARFLLDEFTGEHVSSRLVATASKIAYFLDARANQLVTLARHPAVQTLRSPVKSEREMVDLVRLEADHPDNYGILLFTDDGSLSRAFTGQAAAGVPYWSAPAVPFDRLSRAPLGDAEVLGPLPARDGSSGSFLMRQALAGGGGSIALHVRLASLTELMGAPSDSEVLSPLLRTPAGDFDTVGRRTQVRGDLVVGPEVIPGWRPCLMVDRQEILRPFRDARGALFFASALTGGTVALLLFRLAWRLQQRVNVLVEGTEFVAAGRFGHRVEVSGDDEIALLARRFNRMAARLGRLVERTVRMRRQSALGQFATGIAHEVRNPLAALKTTVQAMARLEREPQRAALLADMEREIDRMARAMTAILTFGRPRPPERTDVPLDQEVRRVVALAAPEAERRRVDLVQGEGLQVAVRVDPDHLRQILLNLVTNALQATPQDGRVTVRARAAADAVEIEIADTGEGIAPDRLARVFEPFYTTKPGGTGLGLAISRQLAELNEGSLVLRSTPGTGTEAVVTLDRGEAPPC